MFRIFGGSFGHLDRGTHKTSAVSKTANANL